MKKQEAMKRSLIRFRRISKILDFSQFFSISVSEYTITVLCWNDNTELLNSLMKQEKFKRIIDNNSITFERNGLIITLAVKP